MCLTKSDSKVEPLTFSIKRYKFPILQHNIQSASILGAAFMEDVL